MPEVLDHGQVQTLRGGGASVHLEPRRRGNAGRCVAGGAGRGAAGLAAGLEVLDGDGLEVDVDPHRDHHHLPQLRAQGSVGSGKAPLKPSRAITKKFRA